MSEEEGTEEARPVESSAEIIAILQTVARIDERTSNLDHRFVQRSEFAPIQKIVYGLVGLILVTVFAGFLGLLLAPKGPAAAPPPAFSTPH